MLKSISITRLSNKRKELSDGEFLTWLAKEYGIKKNYIREDINSYLHCQCTSAHQKSTCSLCPKGTEYYSTIS